jgi:AcrR family transcriptional regulator
VIALREEEADRSVARLATSGSSGSAMRSDSREEMENQLIAAAANLFQRKGFVGATTRELAKSMGLQTSSLYHYLESKQDLLYVVCVRATNAISTQVAEAVKAAPPADRLRSAIQAHVAATLSEQDMHAVKTAGMRSPACTTVITSRSVTCWARSRTPAGCAKTSTPNTSR